MLTTETIEATFGDAHDAVSRWAGTMKVCAVLGVCWLLQACAAQPRAVERASGDMAVRVLSFNIRYGTAPDGANAWPRRKELVADVIRDADIDFVGLQEALRFQIDAIRAAVPGYSEVGVGRDDGQQAGEYSPILYKTGRWEIQDSGTFWLSDTPNVPGSKTWGNEIPRIVTWARFVEKRSRNTMWLFNTHFDHISQSSRLKSAQLLAWRIAKRAPQAPVVATGDFNAGEDNAAILHLTNVDGRSPVRLVDTFRVLHPHANPVGTFNQFEGLRNGPKIDFVFAEPDARVREARIVRDEFGGRYPSDHFPVFAEIALPDSKRMR